MISGPSLLNPNRYPPASLPRSGGSSNLTISEPHRLSIVPELAEEEMADTSNPNNNTPWARAVAAVLARNADARPRILAQVRLFVQDETEAQQITKTILSRRDEIVDECAYGEGSVNAVKRQVENLKIGYTILKGDLFEAEDEDIDNMLRGRLRRKVAALAEKLKAEDDEAEAAKDQGKGKEKEEDDEAAKDQGKGKEKEKDM